MESSDIENDFSNINFKEKKNLDKDIKINEYSPGMNMIGTGTSTGSMGKKNYLDIPNSNNLIHSNLTNRRQRLPTDKIKTNSNFYFNYKNISENKEEGIRICKTFEIQQKSPSENPINLGNNSNDNHNLNRINNNNKSYNYDIDPTETFKRRLSSKFESKNNLKSRIKEFLDNNKFLMVMSIASVYALILSDLNTIFFSKGAMDIIFTIISTVVFILFLIDFLLSCIARDDYVFTFFFWVDFISMLSMTVNIEWIVFPSMNLISSLMDEEKSYTSPLMYKITKSLSGAFRTSR